MSKSSLIRLIKAFIVSAVAVYVFVNAPSLYVNAQYWLERVKPDDVKVSTSGLAVIEPLLLPVSTIEPQPLPP